MEYARKMRDDRGKGNLVVVDQGEEDQLEADELEVCISACLWHVCEYTYWVGLCIVYFKRYDTYHDTHEAIFNMYQHTFCQVLDPKNLIYPQMSQEIWYFNDQNILNLSKKCIVWNIV